MSISRYVKIPPCQGDLVQVHRIVHTSSMIPMIGLVIEVLSSPASEKPWELIALIDGKHWRIPAGWCNVICDKPV